LTVLKFPSSAFLKLLRPYFFIGSTGLLAFAPVSFMIRSLKNDVVALEYPINHFMSQCIHKGEIPYWFNTWAMGFPLQSNLTWGIFSTPQMIFCSVFNYNIYTLHLEFIFFILMAGWGMFHLLKKYFLKDETIAVVLACCYMLSGFIVGAGQWMLYVTAAAFIPIVLSSLLQLLKFPSFKHALLFAVLFFIMFTSVYAALNIITTYCLLLFIGSYLLKLKEERRKKIILLRYIFIAGTMTILLCLPCLIYTLELLKYINRGNPISGNTDFFNSNYLHPYGLSTMLLPFSSVKMSFPNTEGTMLNTYAGLFVLLILPVAILQSIKETNRLSFIILLSAIFFLLISFGSVLPLRNVLNILPGFSYFRNPAIFRSYFIFFLIIYLGIALRNMSWENILNINGPYSRTLKFCFFILSWLCLVSLLFHFEALKTISFSSLPQIIKNISFSQTVFISAIFQLLLLGAIFYSSFVKRYQLVKLLFAADLIINTLLCTPYFVVSSYSLSQVNTILHSDKGFPPQSEMINQVAAIYTDEKFNSWNNVNIFHKKVSGNGSYRGPLELKNFSHYNNDGSAFNHAIVFAKNDSISKRERVELIIQRPTHIRAQVNFNEPTTITAMQNYFPGWNAYYNNKKVEFIKLNKPGLTINIPKGKGTIDFVFSKKSVWITALLLHFFALASLMSYLYRKINRKIMRTIIN
jgi:hypothetical protein